MLPKNVPMHALLVQASNVLLDTPALETSAPAQTVIADIVMLPKQHMQLPTIVAWIGQMRNQHVQKPVLQGQIQSVLPVKSVLVISNVNVSLCDQIGRSIHCKVAGFNQSLFNSIEMELCAFSCSVSISSII